MAAFLLILIAMLPAGGLEKTGETSTIIMATMQTPEPESPELTSVRRKVSDLENKVWWAKSIVILVLVLAGAIGVGIAVVTLRSDWMNDDLRSAEKELTALEIAKVKADSQAQLKIETDKVRIELATQQARAAQAEKDLLELQERIKGRHLPAEGKARLISRLTGDPKGELEIRCPIGSPEAREFALELLQVFKTSGWNATLNDRVIMAPVPVGLKLWVHAERQDTREGEQMTAEAPQRAISILNAFKDSHLSIETQFNPDVPKEGLVLIVGFKL